MDGWVWSRPGDELLSTGSPTRCWTGMVGDSRAAKAVKSGGHAHLGLSGH